jgi:aspartate aminotransferase
VTPAEVVVTTGSKQALFNSCFALFGEDDEVLVPTPAWTSYYEMIDLSRATAVPVEGQASRGFKVTADDLERHATDSTRGVMLNSPCNPTGSVYTPDELSDLVRLAADRNWWVISDEIYRRIAYDGPAAGLLSVARNRERIVVIDGMAKSFAMTGWRIGWAIANPNLARTLTAFQSHTTSNATTVSQYAALEALKKKDDAEAAIEGMVGEYRRRRDAALQLLRAPGGPNSRAARRRVLPVHRRTGHGSGVRGRGFGVYRRDCWRNTASRLCPASRSGLLAGYGFRMPPPTKQWSKG